MRRAVRAIVVKDDHLLVMHRNKFGQEYYTLIGGGIDSGESHEQALLREVAEETGVQVARPELVVVEEAGAPFGTQYIYLCQYVSGEPLLHADSEEAKVHALGQNLYTPMWLSLSELADVPFRSEALKRELIKGFLQGFASPPITIHSSHEH